MSPVIGNAPFGGARLQFVAFLNLPKGARMTVPNQKAENGHMPKTNQPEKSENAVDDLIYT